MSTAIATVTLLCGALILYHHVVYPAILRLVTTRRGPVETPPEIDRAALPTVLVLVPVHNEEDVIAAKIADLIAIDYPRDRFKARLVCDGCTDDTVPRARAALAADPAHGVDIDLVIWPVNRGKTAVINAGVAAADSELVVLTDASATVPADALVRLAAHFRDPRVGVVAGAYRLARPGGAGEAAYWDYQSAIKRGESALGAPLGVHGALYAIRRTLFTPLAADSINDDFLIPMAIVADGHRAVYDQGIVAVERERATAAIDFRRRRRIAAGNFQQAIRMRRLLHPRYRGVAFAFASGKALRAVMPACLIGLFVGSALSLSTHPGFAPLLAVQCGAYGIAALKQVFPALPGPRALETVRYLVAGHCAGLLGILGYLGGAYRGAWKRAS